MDINLLLKKTIERNASDLHLKVGSLPIIRVDGRLVPLEDQQKITQEDAIATAFAIMNNSNKQRFKEKSEADFAYSASGLGRFRVNVFQQRGTIGIVMRAVPTKILSIDDLNLPKVLEKLSMEQRGLVLVTGTTGCG
ncbi:MAG: ATPase, T2SS/T4P/T4SS family, partial [Nitrospirota bacterium]